MPRIPPQATQDAFPSRSLSAKVGDRLNVGHCGDPHLIGSCAQRMAAHERSLGSGSRPYLQTGCCPAGPVLTRVHFGSRKPRMRRSRSRCHVPLGLRRVAFTRRAKPLPNLLHQHRACIARYAPRNDRQRKPLSASYLLRRTLLHQCRPLAAARQAICSRGTAQTPHPHDRYSCAHAAPARRSRRD